VQFGANGHPQKANGAQSAGQSQGNAERRAHSRASAVGYTAPMTAAGTAQSAAPAVVRFAGLLAFYGIVPASLLLVFVDHYGLDGALKLWLPNHPEQILYFTVLFNLPHVLASHVLYLDGEYLRAYRTKLLLFGAAWALFMAFAGPAWLGAVGVIATMYHVLAQQMGLAAPQVRTKSPVFRYWKWGCLLLGLSGYLAMLPVRGHQPPGPLTAAYNYIAIALIPSTLYLSVRLHKLSATAVGRYYVWSNQVMVLGMYGCGILGYPMLTVLMPRVVHDLTALYVYGVHDDNRQRSANANVLYRALSFTGLSPRWLSPLVAVGLAALVREMPTEYRAHLVYWVSGMHYTMESFAWRSGTLNRRSLGFA
jgi:hypothetical protein